MVCEAFEAADMDGSGTLDADKLRLVIEKLQISMTVEEIKREIGTTADKNGDGELSVDFETFSAWWKKHESSPGDDNVIYTGVCTYVHTLCSTVLLSYGC